MNREQVNQWLDRYAETHTKDTSRNALVRWLREAETDPGHLAPLDIQEFLDNTQSRRGYVTARNVGFLQKIFREMMQAGHDTSESLASLDEVTHHFNPVGYYSDLSDLMDTLHEGLWIDDTVRWGHWQRIVLGVYLLWFGFSVGEIIDLKKSEVRFTRRDDKPAVKIRDKIIRHPEVVEEFRRFSKALSYVVFRKGTARVMDYAATEFFMKTSQGHLSEPGFRYELSRAGAEVESVTGNTLQTLPLRESAIFVRARYLLRQEGVNRLPDFKGSFHVRPMLRDIFQRQNAPYLKARMEAYRAWEQYFYS